MKLKKSTLNKLIRSRNKLVENGKLGECAFFTDDEMALILCEAEISFNLTEKEQDHETFFTDAQRELTDYLMKD
jgi:hypothetical protein